ncbi:MAG: riboflavin kinase [Patescibacteria group bacterium]
MHFFGKIIRGRGAGRQLNFPTFNFEIPENLPAGGQGFKLAEGVHVARISWDLKTFPAILFFGRRETFDGKKALEVHVLDEKISEAPESAEVEVLEKIRDVQKFTNEEELKKQIAADCQKAREILGVK